MNLQASIRIPRRAKDGKDGIDGKGISEVKDFYGLSSIETSEPTKWLSYIPNKPADEYLWNYEEIIYTDGTSIETKKRIIQGKDARSIQSVVNAYAYSSSDTVSPTSGWMRKIEDLGEKPDGYFLWVRDDITYTDGTSSSTNGYVVKDGKDGDKGDGAFNISLTKDSFSFKKNDFSNTNFRVQVQEGQRYFYPNSAEKEGSVSLGFFNVQIESNGGGIGNPSITLYDGTTMGVGNLPSMENDSSHIIFKIYGCKMGGEQFTEFRTVTYDRVIDGTNGLPGIPGQIPVKKEWVAGDIHRNNDTVIDYLYVRGATKGLSYWYKPLSTINEAQAPPKGGVSRVGYKRIDSSDELAVDVLLAEEANVANFIFKDEKLLSIRGKTFAGLEILYGEYTEYEFTNRTTQPSVGSSYWTSLPEGTTRFIRFKKNTENNWTVKAIGTYGDRWTVQYADRPDASSWDYSFATGRVWMRIKEAGEQGFRDVVKIDVSDGYDFIPKTYLDGVNGDVKISGTVTAGGMGSARTEIDDAGVQIFNALNIMNIRFGLKNGYAVMEYYDNDGQFLYDLGPNGISEIEVREEKWVEVKLVYLGISFSEVITDYQIMTKYKTPGLQNETTFYRYVSKVVAGQNQDPVSDGKIFNSNNKSSGYITAGVYMNKTVGMQMEMLTEGTGTRIYPSGIQPENESVFDTSPLYFVKLMYYAQGATSSTANAYWNPGLSPS